METKDNKKKDEQTKPVTKNSEPENKEGETIHTINPFTGTQVDITPEDLEGIEKWNEAQTERD